MFKAWTVMDLVNMPSPTDPDVCLCEIDSACDVATLRWGGGHYDIDLSDVVRPDDLLWKIHHIGKKTWPEMTPKRISALIEIVAMHKGWPMYGHAPHPNEAPRPNRDKIAEREKMTADMRYSVIRRDMYRCRACGFSFHSPMDTAIW